MANLTKYNVGIALVVALGGFSYGFGFGVFTTTVGQPGFYSYFNLDPKSNYTANIIDAGNSLLNAGAAIGAIAQGFIADRLGRKRAFAIATTLCIIAGALLAGSVHIAMLITVRFIHGFGLGMTIALVPLYLTEVAPAHRRGRLSGLTTAGFAIGYPTVGFISVGTYYATNETIQWRVPLALTVVGPLALLAGLRFIPESPRYLAWAGRNEEALNVILRLHHDPNDPTESAAHAEYTQIVRQVEFDKEAKATYWEMFRRPSWRRRSLLAMFIQFGAQSTGILGIANFLVLIFGNLGLTGVMPLVLSAVYSTVGTVFVFIVLFVVDRVGRRTMFLIGFPSLAVCLLAEALLQHRYLGTDSSGGLAACLFFIYLYIVCYQFVDAPSFIWCAEIFPTTIRAKGISLAFFAYFVGAITYTSPSALAFKNISWRMYLLYMALCICCTIIVYFFVPETKQIPLEEIGALFGDEIVVHLTNDGHGIVEKQLELSDAPTETMRDRAEHEEDSKGPTNGVLHVE